VNDMKLIMESWRMFLKEEVTWAGFHGKGGRPNPNASRGRGGGMIQLGCLEDFYDDDTGEGDLENPSPDGSYDVWEREGDGGCPQFENSESVGSDEIAKAVNFLNDRKPTNLVAYSRGGAIAYLAAKSGQLSHIPNIYYVAPAWKKQGSLPAGNHSGGIIIHGTHDVRVPLKHSIELSIATGLPLAIFPRYGHLADILGVAQKPGVAETIVQPSTLKNLPYDLLPDWRERIQYWKVRPDESLGTTGEKSDEILSIEDAQQRWYEEHILGSKSSEVVTEGIWDHSR